MRSKNLLLATSFAVLAGCSSDPVSPSPLSGTLAFNYSGGISGTFSASGALSAGTAATGYAVGGRDPANTGTVVLASLPRTATTNDIVSLFIPRLTSGSSTIDVACVTTACAALSVTFGLANASGDFVRLCFLTTGTLDLTTISSSRATGTFSGTGDCFSQTAPGTTTAFTVTGGTFDVAIVPFLSG